MIIASTDHAEQKIRGEAKKRKETRPEYVWMTESIGASFKA